jgi:hypothetical protein
MAMQNYYMIYRDAIPSKIIGKKQKAYQLEK